jgi:hypothetical protein
MRAGNLALQSNFILSFYFFELGGFDLSNQRRVWSRRAGAQPKAVPLIVHDML